MFWLLEHKLNDFNFIMKFVNFECHKLEDNDPDVYEFKNINSIVNYTHNINCEVTMIENLIRYKTNNFTYYFKINKEELNNNSITYNYTQINESEFPYVKLKDYDFIEKVNFKIVVNKNGDLLIKEEINGEYRYYEISKL